MPARIPLTMLCLGACMLLAVPAVSIAQVRQCIAADGGLVYTDKQCVDIGGRERQLSPMPASGGAATRYYRDSCVRSVEDLAYSLGSAIQSGDVNRIAGLYDWSGMSTANGYRLMDRLQAIADRPLVDVQPMYAGESNEYGDAIVQFDEQTGAVLDVPRASPRLIGLRVEQTLGNGSTPSRTLLGLRKRQGCWWIHL
jgi:hypothetical protein